MISSPEVLADFYQNPVRIIPIDDHRFTLTSSIKIAQRNKSPQIIWGLVLLSLLLFIFDTPYKIKAE